MKIFRQFLVCVPMTTSSKKCIIPFKYNGVSYEGCTVTGNGNTLWCATSVDSNGNTLMYGNCRESVCGGYDNGRYRTKVVFF